MVAVKLSDGVVVALETLVVNSGERLPALKVVTVPDPLAAWHVPSAPRYKVPEHPLNSPIMSALAAFDMAPVVVVFLTIPVPSDAQF